MLLLRPSLPSTPTWDTALRVPWEAGLADWSMCGRMEESAGASAAAPTTRRVSEALEPSRTASLPTKAI